MMRLTFVFVTSMICHSMTAYGEAPTDRVKLLLEYKQAKALFATPFKDLQDAIDRRAAYTPITDQRRERILQIGEKIYKQDNIYEVLVAAYATFADPRVVETEIKMFQSPAGQAYASALADAAASDFKMRVTKYWQDKDFAEMKANRKNSIGSYLKQSKQADERAIVMIGMDIAVDLSLNAFKRRRYRKTLKTIKHDTRLRRNNYVMDSSTETLRSMAYSLRQMKTGQIDMITRFFYSRDGEKAVQTYLHAIEVTMDRAGQTLMHNLNPDTKKPINPPATIANPKPQKDTQTVNDNPKETKAPPKSSKAADPKSATNPLQKKPSLLQPKK